MALHKKLRPIHPFPARMAPEVVWDELPANQPGLKVLDPMSGSGTTLVTAKLRGYNAIGYDRDPLAIMIAKSWLTNVAKEKVEVKSKEVLARAREKAKKIRLSEAYPRNADPETKAFIRYWFDKTNRIQLKALSEAIGRLHDDSLRNILWCALSRLIITKKTGVSLAMDISHSRPHRSYYKAPINAFDRFEQSVNYIIRCAPFPNIKQNAPSASVELGDARYLPLKDNSIDIVITSPPYLNAIDYIRGHKFSLVWMGYGVKALRNLRATNVGSERITNSVPNDPLTQRVIDAMCEEKSLSSRNAGMVRRYIQDMRSVMSETQRVLKSNGKAVFVVGDCNIRQTFVRNSKCIESLANELGMKIMKIRSRPLPDNRRYLPPPESSTAGKALTMRMKEEVIITVLKL